MFLVLILGWACDPPEFAPPKEADDAGPDQSVTLESGTVTLDGSATGVCGSPAWSWAVQARPTGSQIASLEPVKDPIFRPDARGSYVFSLAVFDGAVGSSPDFVTIMVE